MAEINLNPDSVILAESILSHEGEEELDSAILSDDNTDTGFVFSEGGFFVVSVDNPAQNIDSTITIKVFITSMATKGTVTTDIAFDPEGPFTNVDGFDGQASDETRTISVTLTSAQVSNINNLLIRVGSNVPDVLIGEITVIATTAAGGQIILYEGLLVITQGEITI